MNLLSSIITYVRRIIKSPSNTVITDNLIIDYINRFWLMDVDARIQLFDLQTKYQFQTIPGIDQYNMPLYSYQTEPGNQQIASFPLYQGFMMPARVNGISIPLYTQTALFYDLWPNYVQQQIQVGTGDGTTGPYSLNLPFFPAIPGHVDLTGVIASSPTSTPQDPILGTTLNTLVAQSSVYSGVYFFATGANGQNIVVQDSGQFLSNNTDSDIYGLLMSQGQSPGGGSPLVGGYSTTLNTVNYNTGVANVTFPSNIPTGTPISAQSYFFERGIPRSVLFYNNILTLRPPPNTQYLVEIDAYLTPAAMLATGNAISFGYMAEYIARGAARKILADTGDVEQFNFYEPLFKEQETLVWKRSQRQKTATRTDTIFSNSGFQNNYNQSSIGT
jgi:hypothetical protein